MDATQKGGSMKAIAAGIKNKAGAQLKKSKDAMIAEAAKLSGLRGHSRGAAKTEMAKVKLPDPFKTK